MEGMIGWILLIPGLYFMLFGRVFTFGGFFEIPSNELFIRTAGLAFVVAGLSFQLDIILGMIGVVVATVMMIVAIVLGAMEWLKRRPGSQKTKKT